MWLLLRTVESELSWRSLWDSIILQCSFPSGWYIPRQFSTRKDLMPRLLISFDCCFKKPGGWAVGRTRWSGLNLLLCDGDKRSHLAGRRSQNVRGGDFPGDPVVETLPSKAGDVCLIPGWGAKILHAWWPKPKTYNRSNIVTKPIKIFKDGPHKKQTNKKL